MSTGVLSLRKERKKISKAPLYKIILCVVLFMAIVVPLFNMLFGINKQDLINVFTADGFGEILLNTVWVSFVSTIITVVIAYFLAICSERVNIKFMGIFEIVWILPMLVPSISHGMGLIILFGNNGLLTNLFNFDASIYGFWGIVIGSVLYSFPVAFIMFRDIMKYEDASPYEAAQVLGISKFRRFTAITVPFLRKPLISVLFAVFTMVITDYGVPLMVGGKYKTISIVMYQDVIGQLNFSTGSVYGLILLVPAVVTFLFDFLNKDRANSAFVIKPVAKSNNVASKIAGYVYCVIVSILTILPIFSFLVLGFTRKYPSDMSFSFYNIERVLDLGGDKYLLNSLIVSLFVALFGTFIGFITAYFTARMKSSISKLLHLITITAMAIPGIVLGLSYVITYSGSAIYGTIIILIMVNIVHFIASPYLMMYNSFNKINENLEAVSDTLGISRFKLVRDVFLPQSVSTLLEMFMYFFVNSMMTISAVSFLSNTVNKPISLMINQFEAQMQLGNAGIVALFILVINTFMKAILFFARKYLAKR